MKKTYIHPEVEIVKLSSKPLLSNTSPMDLTNEDAQGEVLSSGWFDNGDTDENW